MSSKYLHHQLQSNLGVDTDEIESCEKARGNVAEDEGVGNDAGRGDLCDSTFVPGILIASWSDTSTLHKDVHFELLKHALITTMS